MRPSNVDRTNTRPTRVWYSKPHCNLRRSLETNREPTLPSQWMRHVLDSTPVTAAGHAMTRGPTTRVSATRSKIWWLISRGVGCGSPIPVFPASLVFEVIIQARRCFPRSEICLRSILGLSCRGAGRSPAIPCLSHLVKSEKVFLPVQILVVTFPVNPRR